jgi:hypothetical protein
VRIVAVNASFGDWTSSRAKHRYMHASMLHGLLALIIVERTEGHLRTVPELTWRVQHPKWQPPAEE